MTATTLNHKAGADYPLNIRAVEDRFVAALIESSRRAPRGSRSEREIQACKDLKKGQVTATTLRVVPMIAKAAERGNLDEARTAVAVLSALIDAFDPLATSQCVKTTQLLENVAERAADRYQDLILAGIATLSDKISCYERLLEHRKKVDVAIAALGREITLETTQAAA